MGHKIEAGCEIRGRYGLKLAWRDRDALISIGRMRDSFEIDSEMRDFNRKRPFESLTKRD